MEESTYIFGEVNVEDEKAVERIQTDEDWFLVGNPLLAVWPPLCL